MKIIISLLLVLVASIIACNEPLQVTGKTDPQTTTSGTLGSVRATNQMPEGSLDTPAVIKRDTTKTKH